jgi:hypothetical protein
MWDLIANSDHTLFQVLSTLFTTQFSLLLPQGCETRFVSASNECQDECKVADNAFEIHVYSNWDQTFSLLLNKTGHCCLIAHINLVAK